MYPAPFEYMAPNSVEETIELLERYGEEAKVLAGGQSLIPLMHLRFLAPSYVIDINGLDDGGARVDGRSLVVPALTRQRSIEYSEVVKEHCPLLPDAVRFIGNPRVRTRGTAGGNLAHADPTSELAVSCLAARAEITVQGSRGTRVISAHDLFVTYLTTCLEPSELITEIRMPVVGTGTGWAFLEMAMRAGEFAIVNVASLLTLDDSTGECTDVSVAVGGVSDRPVDVSAELAEVLLGEAPDDRLFQMAGPGPQNWLSRAMTFMHRAHIARR